MSLVAKNINKNNKNVTGHKGFVCALLVCLLPFLCTYKSGIPGIMLGELVFIVFTITMLIKHHELKIAINPSIISFVVIIVISELMLITGIIGNNSAISGPIIRTIRFLFYIYIIFHVCYQYFDYDKASKYIKVIGIIASVFLIVQFFYGSVLGINVIGYIPGLTYEELDTVSSTVDRYKSFFTEPAYYGQYVLVPLALMLYQKQKKRIDIIGIPVITFGIILSTSGSAYVSIVVLYIFFILLYKNLSFMKRIGFILLILIITYFIMNYSQSFNFTLERLQNTSAIHWRMNAYNMIGSLVRLNPLILFTGVGYGNTTHLAGYFTHNNWYPSIIYFMVCLGVPGIVSFICTVYSGYRQSGKLISSLAMLVLVLAQSVYTDAFHTYWFIYYMPFLYAFGDRREYFVQGKISAQ